MTHKDWYAIKQRNQTKYMLLSNPFGASRLQQRVILSVEVLDWLPYHG